MSNPLVTRLLMFSYSAIFSQSENYKRLFTTMNSKYTKICLLIIVCTLAVSCGSLEQTTSANSQPLLTPKVTGIIITDETGTEIGIWGTPKSNLNLFPNPTSTNMSLEFQLTNNTANVAIWALSALSPYEDDDRFRYGGGASIYVGGPRAPITLFESILPSGSHSIFLDYKDLPSGFYTVYLSIGGELQEADIFIARNIGDLPSYLKEALGYL